MTPGSCFPGRSEPGADRARMTPGSGSVGNRPEGCCDAGDRDGRPGDGRTPARFVLRRFSRAPSASRTRSESGGRSPTPLRRSGGPAAAARAGDAEPRPVPPALPAPVRRIRLPDVRPVSAAPAREPKFGRPHMFVGQLRRRSVRVRRRKLHVSGGVGADGGREPARTRLRQNGSHLEPEEHGQTVDGGLSPPGKNFPRRERAVHPVRGISAGGGEGAGRT